jgi:hypothetical protein
MKTAVFLLVTFCLITISIGAQQKRVARKGADVRLVKGKPSVYITFERLGEREPLEPGESREGIWLRFHNNTKWPISFRSFGVPKELGEVGMYYEIEELPQSPLERGSHSSTEAKEEIKRKSEIPIGYLPGDSFDVISIESGDSILLGVSHPIYGDLASDWGS